MCPGYKPVSCPHQMQGKLVLEPPRSHRYWGARRLVLELLRRPDIPARAAHSGARLRRLARRKMTWHVNRELDPGVLEAIRRSSLSAVKQDTLDSLLETAVLHEVAPGATIHGEGDPAFLELVLEGMIRAYVSAPSGRTMTIRYCRAGSLIGTGTVFNDGTAPGRGNLTALVTSRLLRLRPAAARALAQEDVSVAGAFLRETSSRMAEYINELHASQFASLRQRLARHLLDLAADQQAGSRLVAWVSQEELAGAVGTVREVVVRILREMRNDGLVRTGRGAVELLDPARLDAETATQRAGAAF
jgi:CRP/FNR family transcriptional regulator, cyclic AMP receptor protein